MCIFYLIKKNKESTYCTSFSTFCSAPAWTNNFRISKLPNQEARWMGVMPYCQTKTSWRVKKNIKRLFVRGLNISPHLVLLIYLDPALQKKLNSFALSAGCCKVKRSSVMLMNARKHKLLVIMKAFQKLFPRYPMMQKACEVRPTAFFALAFRPFPRTFMDATSFLLAASINCFSPSSTAQ